MGGGRGRGQTWLLDTTTWNYDSLDYPPENQSADNKKFFALSCHNYFETFCGEGKHVMNSQVSLDREASDSCFPAVVAIAGAAAAVITSAAEAGAASAAVVGAAAVAEAAALTT